MTGDVLSLFAVVSAIFDTLRNMQRRGCYSLAVFGLVNSRCRRDNREMQLKEYWLSAEVVSFLEDTRKRSQLEKNADKEKSFCQAVLFWSCLPGIPSLEKHTARSSHSKIFEILPLQRPGAGLDLVDLKSRADPWLLSNPSLPRARDKEIIGAAFF